MLNWWLGRPTEGCVDDNDPNREPPETPAPVFAARALRSAIFGVPAQEDDDTIYEVERESRAESNEATKELQPRNLSPTKPPGILLTPGTATTRRKTVSFGNDVAEKAEKEDGKKNAGGKRRNRTLDDGDKQFPTPFATKSESSARPLRKTSLTRALENSRQEKTPKYETQFTSLGTKTAAEELQSTVDQSLKLEAADKVSKSHPNVGLQQSVEDENTDMDMTVDLNQPHSRSGKFWKSEYEQYHEEALVGMKKLLNYKELAKQYAKHKDAENIDLAKKLKESQETVANMEDRMFEISARIALLGKDGNGDEAPELVKELARQAALGVQYQAQVEEFRAALEGDENSPSKHARKHRSSRRSQENETDTGREMRQAREQLREMASVKEELSSVRQSLTTAEKLVQRLQEENTKLTQQLLHADLRLEKHLETCETKRQSSDEHRRKRDEAVQNLQNDYDRLKEQAKSQRRDAEHLLKKRHDQVVDLKKEIASLRGADSIAQEDRKLLQEKTTEHDNTVAELRTEIDKLKHKLRQKDTTSSREERERRTDVPSLSSKPLPIIEPPQMRDSHIPVLSQSISRPSKVLMSNSSRSKTPTDSSKHRSSHSALSELMNTGNGEPTPFQRSGPMQHTPQGPITPLVNRFSNMSLESPELLLPPAEPSSPVITSRAIHERNCRPSPAPSMFNISSSPPKAATVRPRGSNELSRQKSNSNINARQNANTASSRASNMDSSRMRIPIPPERAAAARARLEQKQAEKRRAQVLGGDKENIVNSS
ncbi:uncharacterized protein RSE6_06697 [Rhynchosporium secalis]|uniref:Spindle pole body-associated protein cut12 domain-containing protein n=1 Tax=Rhynchosporium secalis TaxID=38038 RepID=A0A1E1MB63_RHYSE|nr:uncharacterized protein RSE6_06697 [Rhynchosporium secalis]